jgi:hypothetical protein
MLANRETNRTNNTGTFLNPKHSKKITADPGYNDIGLCDTSSIASDILWYPLIPHCQP